MLALEDRAISAEAAAKYQAWGITCCPLADFAFGYVAGSVRWDFCNDCAKEHRTEQQRCGRCNWTPSPEEALRVVRLGEVKFEHPAGIPAKIHALRVGLGLSQQGLADQAKTAKSHVADLETGRRRAGPVLAARLAAVLGVEASELQDPTTLKQVSYAPGLPERLHSLRAARGLSQGALAKRASVSQSHICDIERGRTTSMGVALAGIAKALGVEVAALTGEEEAR